MGTTEKHPVKHIVILGAGGQIGSSIHHYLRQHFPHIRITACVRQLPEKAAGHYTVFHPFTDNWQLLARAEVVINCIGIIRETRHFTFEQAHAGLTRLILQNRQILGNPKIIQISALGAAPDSPAAFLSTKARADNLLLINPGTVVVRPSIVCTPGTVFARKLQLLSRISRYLGHLLPFPQHLLQTRIQPVMAEDLAGIVAKLCFTDEHPSLIPAVGPDKFSLQELIRLSDRRILLTPIPKTIADPFTRLVAAIFPGIVNRQQYELLLTNNVAGHETGQKLLGRALQSTSAFWQHLNPDGETGNKHVR
jgi:uncharacterized protein YbjT (DUF2867 family)